jgi:hypothetical protein
MSSYVQKRAPAALVFALALAGVPSRGTAQGFDPVTTRAAGMGGAFVAVADDASAVYWNPGALASGAFFSLLLDRTSARATLEEVTDARGGSRSGTLLALGTPPLGLSYYRLRSSRVAPDPVNPQAASAASLITHNTGVTFVQSLADGVAVGTTIRYVRGIATSTTLPPAGDIQDLLDEASDLIGEASNKIDADVGVSAVFGTLRAGLTVRNLASPTFDALGGGGAVRMERQARAGVALNSPFGFVVALDADLNAVRGPLGERRELAVGTEARLVPRAYARAGVRTNLLGNQPGGRAATVSIGASYAALASLWVDAQGTFGSEAGGRGWGVAARVGF